MSDENIKTSEEPETIDVGDAYKPPSEEIAVDILSSSYSNVTYMQVAPRDVVLDFLAFPSIRRENKNVVSGVRIYMSHAAARSLAEKLGKLLEDAYKDGKIEELKFTKTEDVGLSTKISRPTTEELV
jgi:hypothetical protein